MQLHPMFFALALLAAPLAAHAQATGDPIATSAPVAPWSLVLEDVVQIPDSSGAAAPAKGAARSPKTEKMRKTLSFTGVILSSRVKYAMIRKKSRKKGQEGRGLYREGDEVHGMTLKEIGSNYVVLADKGQDVKLKLYEGRKARPAPPRAPKVPARTAPAKTAAGKGKAAAPSGGSAKGAKVRKLPAAGSQAPAGMTPQAVIDALEQSRQSGGNGPSKANPFLKAIQKAKEKQ